MRLGGRRFLLVWAVVAAGVLLALAVHLPFMRLSRLLYLGYGAHGHSLISAVSALIRSSQVAVGGTLLVLAILLPLLKLLYLVLLAALPQAEINRSAAQLRTLAWLGRWSPQDLAALALAAVLIAGHGTLAQHVAAGAYCFAGAVLTMALAYAWLRGDVSGTRLWAPAGHAAAPRGTVFAMLAALATLAFALGVTLPVVRLGTAYAGTDRHSIVSLVLALQARGETLLWAVLLALGLLLPGLRLIHLLTLAAARALPAAVRSKAVLATGALGRFATTDTMVLALMLLYLVAAGHADAVPQPGVYGLVAAAGLTLVAYAWANMVPPAASVQPSSLAARLASVAAAGTGGSKA